MQNRHHSRQGLRLHNIDSLDLCMRMRAAERACEEHAVLAHVLRVVTKIGHDPEAMKARNSLPHDIKLLGLLGRRLCGRTRCRSLGRRLWPRRGLTQLRRVET